MIKTVADLLQAFLARERTVLASRTDISHGPTIGAMYEGLTREALNRVIPSTAPLFVSTGFARGRDGTLSQQLDCILATSEGSLIEHTESRVFAVEDVVATIEVKKTLGAASLDDGYLNLHSVVQLEPAKPPPFKFSALKTAFQQVTGLALPDEPKALPPATYEVYRYLLRDALVPVRILLGYEGYTTARGLRQGVVDQLEKLVGRAGAHSPATLPNLISSSSQAVGKLNGMPWAAPSGDDDGRVLILASSGGTSPASILLEMIWSRLNYLGLLSSDAFGEDLELEQWVRLVAGKAIPGRGWEFDSAPAAVPANDRRVSIAWEPIEVTKDEYTLLSSMGSDEAYEFDLDEARPGDGPSEQRLLETLAALRKKHLIGIDPTRPRVHRLLTRNMVTAFLPDGRSVAGENASGRMERWVMKQIDIANKPKIPP